MANGEWGGYRRPENPAPVSGPGALSQRTDGGAATQPEMLAAGGPYGSRQDMASIQGGAPMAGTASGVADLTSLSAPTARPTEPVTHGAGTIPGMQPSTIDDATRERILSALPTLAWLASQPKASEQTRQFVRQIKGDI